MATLSTAARKRLPRTAFALPRRRAYPIPDRSHARNAMARAAQHATASEQRTVARAVQRKYPALARRSTFVRRVLGRSRAS